MRKFVFIVNPVAGKVKSSGIINRLNALVEANPADYKVIFSQKPFHAIELSQEITSESQAETLVAVGGDGTVHEIVNGFNLESNCSLAVLPFGSGNDISRCLYRTKKDYLNILLDKQRTELTKLDVGSIFIESSKNISVEKRFINAVGIGFDAYVAYLNQYEKILTGVPSYLIAVWKALKDSTGLDIKIKIDDKRVITGKYLLTTIGNGKTSGGGFFLNPDADPTDGIYNITTVDFTDKMTILRKLPYALINKLKNVKLASFYEGKNIELELNAPYYVHLDGEIASQDAVKISVHQNRQIKVLREK